MSHIETPVIRKDDLQLIVRTKGDLEATLVIKDAPSLVSPVNCHLSDPFITVDFLPTGVPTGGQIRWRGMGQGIDGKLYSIPYYHDSILTTDPEAGTVTEGPSVAGWPAGNELRKWVDCVSLPDGRIIANPYQARGHLIVDTTASPATTRAVLAANGDPISSDLQTRGGAVINDTFFGTTYQTSPNANLFVRRFTVSTERYLSALSCPVRRDGPFYLANPDFSDGQSFGTLSTDTYWGAVAAPAAGKAYGIPFGQDRISIIDEDTMTVSQGEDTLTGGIEIETWATPPDAYLGKYTGGTLSSINGCVYAMPRNANAVLKIDPTDDSATELPLPASYIVNPADTKALGSVEGPDGRIYGVLWQDPRLLWIDPRTDEIGFVDLSPWLDQTGTTRNFYAYGQRVGNALYFSPASAQTVMKLTIYSGLNE